MKRIAAIKMARALSVCPGRPNVFGPRASIAVACALLLGTAGAVSAAPLTPYVVTIEQVGANVVATGSGEFNVTGLTSSESDSGLAANVDPVFGGITLGAGNRTNYDGGLNATGPTNFGSGFFTTASSSSGPQVSFGFAVSSDVVVPLGYISGTLLAPSTATFDNTTLALLGITVGTYAWTWGSAADQSFTIDVVATTPLPATLPLFATGLGGLGLLARRRKRTVQTLAT
jgi:hypothetical protein